MYTERILIEFGGTHVIRFPSARLYCQIIEWERIFFVFIILGAMRCGSVFVGYRDDEKRYRRNEDAVSYGLARRAFRRWSIVVIRQLVYVLSTCKIYFSTLAKLPSRASNWLLNKQACLHTCAYIHIYLYTYCKMVCATVVLSRPNNVGYIRDNSERRREKQKGCDESTECGVRGLLSVVLSLSLSLPLRIEVAALDFDAAKHSPEIISKHAGFASVSFPFVEFNESSKSHRTRENFNSK